MAFNTLMVIDPVHALEQAKQRSDIVRALRMQEVLREGVDYGVVPGSSKPTLLKPGAERLCAAMGFNPRFELINKVERWEGDSPLFHYQYCCHLIHIDSGLEVATGIGSCNSMEEKYRWRWVQLEDVPTHLEASRLKTRSTSISEFKFAVDKAETTGKYGKPAAYWQQFRDAIEDGSARPIQRKDSKGTDRQAWEIGGVSYRVPNDEIFSLINTVDKMAQKRALIAATLIGANASEFFTQDIEDMPGFGYIEGEYEVVTPAALPAPAPVQPQLVPKSQRAEKIERRAAAKDADDAAVPRTANGEPNLDVLFDSPSDQLTVTEVKLLMGKAAELNLSAADVLQALDIKAWSEYLKGFATACDELEHAAHAKKVAF